MQSFVVHYQELALKGRNRPWFIDRLVRNLRDGTRGLGVGEVRPLMGRVEVGLREGADVRSVAERIGRTFGIANFSLAERVAPDIGAITACALRRSEGVAPGSFRVAATRADKSFPLKSPEIERLVGGAVKQARGWAVDLDHPEVVVYVEVVPGAAFCFVGKRRGPGGLPSGVSGKAVCLLSGGIDSPVAAWRMMKRGCRVVFVHFHSYPIVSKVSQEKAQQITGVLTQYQLRSRLILVPFGDVQRQIVATAPPALRTVLYRRFMFRIADRLAHRAGARALVTGEVVGQVASQTLENLAIIDSAAAMPVLRPLVGMDKEEITSEAKRIGTYEISIVPDEDCCQVFSPRYPATHAHFADVEATEAELDVRALVDTAVAAAVHEKQVLAGIEDLDEPLVT
jgi:thiamine biosynthesis protein ThiI